MCNSSSAHVRPPASAAPPRSLQPQTRLLRDFLLFRLKVGRATFCEKENERNVEREGGADGRADWTGPTAGPRSAEQRRRPATLRMCSFQGDGTGFHEVTQTFQPTLEMRPSFTLHSLQDWFLKPETESEWVDYGADSFGFKQTPENVAKGVK